MSLALYWIGNPARSEHWPTLRARHPGSRGNIQAIAKAAIDAEYLRHLEPFEEPKILRRGDVPVDQSGTPRCVSTRVTTYQYIARRSSTFLWWRMSRKRTQEATKALFPIILCNFSFGPLASLYAGSRSVESLSVLE